MKKILLTLVLFSLLSLPLLTAAQVGEPESPPTGLDIWTVIDRITNYLFGFLMVVAVILIIYAAFLFLTAAGDPEKVGRGRTTLIYAVVGIAVALLAKGIVVLIRTIIVG